MKGLSLSTMPTTHAAIEEALPAEDLTALLPPGWPLDTPLARIRTCGPLTVEVVTDLQVGPDGYIHAVYGPPAARLFTIRGMGTALVLLALLASQPGCLASKDFLMQTLAHLRHSDTFSEEDEREEDEDEPLKRLDNVVSLLRKLLCPPVLLPFPGANLLRKRLVRLVRATAESGSGYRLASFPLLWLDVEAMETYAVRAWRLEERGEDGLEDWQAVYQVGMRGSFLGHEPYSAWADWRRGRVTELLWQSVGAQGQRALRWEGGQSGLEAAARLLHDFWQAHMTNEDAFRALVEVLGRQDRFQQVEECYTQLCVALEREGRLPQPRTQEAMTALRLDWERQASQRRLPMVVSSQAGSPAGEDEASSDQLLPETRHLIGREAWLRGICQMVQGFPSKKLLVVQGPIGIGKSSELTRLAERFQQASARVIWLRLPTTDRSGGPEAVLDMVLATMLSQCGVAPFPAEAPRERLVTALLSQLRQESRPTVILLDNAECLLEENGALAACCEAFLTQWVRSRHPGSILLATNEWQGWPGRENLFVAETMVPPLTPAESVCLLQRQGLDGLPTEQLQAVGERMSGIPLLLEWTARLLADPLLLNDWRGFGEDDTLFQAATTQKSMMKRLQRLLDDPALLNEHLASRLTPLLQRIMDKQLSPEARQVLERLAVATIPLGKPALQMLCPRPALLKELRDASLLAAYANRVQVLPMVAETVRQQFLPEQRKEREAELIEACRTWRKAGIPDNGERGIVVTELATLLLKHHLLVDAAVLLMLDGWLSFNLGNGTRLAEYAFNVMQQFDWQATEDNRCGGLLLKHMLCAFLGQPVDEEQRARDYQSIYESILGGKVVLSPNIELHVTHRLMFQAIQALHFEDAQALLEVRSERLAKTFPLSLLEERASLYGEWSDYAYEQGDHQRARELREQAIMLYRECCQKIAAKIAEDPHNNTLRKQGLGRCLNNLGYNLNRGGRYEEALQAIEESLSWREQGYVEFGGLAASYGEKSQILMELGRLQEAILFDKKAVVEIERRIETGNTRSREEAWIYRVNRARLYLRLGRVDEAEQLLHQALPCYIPGRRRIYRMFAEDALGEIEQWRQQTTTSHHQLDWRWIKRYRQLASYDSYWWWAQAGPFTEEEQQQWEQLYTPDLDETTKERIGKLISRSCWRELRAAVAEQRQPSLRYPALDADEIRRRIAGVQQLATEISQQEPNAIVKRLYQGALEEEATFLGMIVATSEGDTARYQNLNRQLGFEPTLEEMNEALARLKPLLHQGLRHPATVDVTQQLLRLLRERLHLSFDLTSGEEEGILETSQEKKDASSSSPHMITAQAAKRFFEAAFRESGYEGWSVTIDPTASVGRVESAAHQVSIPVGKHSVDYLMIDLFAHEFAGHVARTIAGERSPLGLLGIGTRGHMATEEGFALYHERQVATLHGKPVGDEGTWFGALATGLASGVATPPQTFLELFTFFELFHLLRLLLKEPEQDMQKAQTRARNRALTRCLRTYRGVPDLEQAAIWYGIDVSYLRGFLQIQRAATKDEIVLDRLAVGKIALDDLPDMQELGILSAPQPLKKLAYDPGLEAYILSFEQADEPP